MSNGLYEITLSKKFKYRMVSRGQVRVTRMADGSICLDESATFANVAAWRTRLGKELAAILWRQK